MLDDIFDRWTEAEIPNSGGQSALIYGGALETTPAFMGVYFLVRDGSVFYVGLSMDIPQRIDTHLKNGRRFDCAMFIPLDNADDLRVNELRWINVLQPIEQSKRDLKLAAEFNESVFRANQKKRHKYDFRRRKAAIDNGTQQAKI